MIKRVIFHIGAPKTGTSIIQSHLAQNREVLRDKGYLYPITISSIESLYRTFESHHLLTYSWADWEPFNKFDPAGFWQRIEATAEEYNLHTLILSAENTYWLPRQIAEHEQPEEDEYWAEKKAYIERVYEDLKHFETKIVVYLRRQDRWIESWFNQQIKNGRHLKNDMMEFVNHHHFLLDYHRLIGMWAQVFGHENIIARPYEKKQLQDGLLEDFLQTTGIGTADDFPLRQKGRHNAQLTPDAMNLINICNGLELDPGDSYWLRLQIRKLTNQFDSQAKFLNQGLLSPQSRITVLEKYAPINERVAKDFMMRSDGTLFHEEWPDPNDNWEPNHEVNTSFMTEVLLKLIFQVRAKDAPSPVSVSSESDVSLTAEEISELDQQIWNERLWDYE